MDGTVPRSHDVARYAAGREAVRRWIRLCRRPYGVRATQLVLLLTVLVPMLMLQVAVYYSWYQTHRDAELQSNLEMARAVAGAFETHIQDILHQELAVGLAFASHANVSVDNGQILAQVANQYPAMRSYNWVGPRGEVLISTDSSLEGSNLRAAPYFREIAEGADWAISDLFPDLTTGEPVVAVAQSARGWDGALRGIVVATIDPAGLGRAVPIRRTGDASFALFDRQGMMLYRSPVISSSTDRERIGRDPSVTRVLEGEESTAIVQGPGRQSRFAARAPVPSIGWVVVASRSAEEAMAPVVIELVTYAVLSLLVSISAVLGALVIGRRLTAPLDRLHADAVAIGEGDFGREVNVSGPAELVDLAAALDKMAKEVRIREENLRRRSEGLRFLADAGNVLAMSLDFETTLISIPHLSVPRMADWCVVELPADGEVPRRVASDHLEPACQEALRQLLRRPPSFPGSHDPVSRVLASGRPELIADVTDELLVEMAGDGPALAAYRQLGLASMMVVPLVVRGRTFGAIVFASGGSRRRYDSEDLALMELLARRAALAMDNARLYGQVQESVRMRDEFFSVAAHELKTPITSLRGFAQLAVRQLDKTGELDPGRARQALQVMDEQSQKLSNLVTQLLDVSRLEAGRLSLARIVTDIAPLVEGIAASAMAAVGQREVVFRASGSVRAPVDPLRLEQVLTNLLDNAVKYSPNDSPVEVSVDAPDAATARIIVRDHGVGIPIERRTRIFDRFYQAHSESYYGGMGLGLYISREIVILHGGKIEAEFPEDGGTRFVVSLPREIEGSSTDSADAAELP